MEENGLVPSPKKEIRSPDTTESPQEIWNFSQPLATRYKINFYPQLKNICGQEGYIPWKIRIQIQTTRKLFKVEENCRNYNQNHFYCLRFIFTNFFTGSFQVSSSPPKVPIPIQNPNLTYIPPI